MLGGCGPLNFDSFRALNPAPCFFLGAPPLLAVQPGHPCVVPTVAMTCGMVMLILRCLSASTRGSGMMDALSSGRCMLTFTRMPRFARRNHGALTTTTQATSTTTHLFRFATFLILSVKCVLSAPPHSSSKCSPFLWATQFTSEFQSSSSSASSSCSVSACDPQPTTTNCTQNMCTMCHHVNTHPTITTHMLSTWTICIYLYIYIDVFMCVCRYVCMLCSIVSLFVLLCVCLCVCLCACYVGSLVRACMCVRMPVRFSFCVYVCAYVCK